MAASSKFKGMNDLKKYEKARKLKDHIESIRADYKKKLADKSILTIFSFIKSQLFTFIYK